MHAMLRRSCPKLALVTLIAGCSGLPVSGPATVEIAVADVQPGDVVQIETTDGSWLGFMVTGVTEATIVAAGTEVSVADIVALSRVVDGDRPACGGHEPLGCSIPDMLSDIASYHNEYKGRFHGACTQHDLCYRHGHRTYRRTREVCDAAFHQAMKSVCTSSWLDFDIRKKLEQNARCLLVAEELYQGVRKYGEKHFRTGSSSYCEYDGPPPVPDSGPPL